MAENPGNSHSPQRIRQVAGNLLAALWIIGVAGFFLVRFSIVFYRANQSAIDSLVQRLRH